MTPYTRAQLQIHACVFLWGFTAVLGRAISLPAIPLVFWRMILVVGLLLLATRVRRSLWTMSSRLRLTYACIGVVVSIHWLAFYASIKVSNASVGATCLAVAPVFASLVEPWVTRSRFDPRELLLGVFVVPGVVLAVGGVPVAMRAGLVLGAISAFFAALFGSLNKRYVHEGDPLAVTCLELGAGVVVVSLLALVTPHAGPVIPLPGARDAALLLTLSVACTLLPFALSLVALRHLSAFSVQLATNLEPVYSIVFAALLLGERRELGLRFYAGVVVVLIGVGLHPLLVRSSARGVVDGGEVLRAVFTPTDCARWTAGTYAARAVWTADFGDDQFSLGRAFYTHLEQGRSAAYFADAAASDARVETYAPGLQSAMRDLAARIVGGRVHPRRGWCGPGIHVFPAGGHVAKRGGVVHFDTEGLTDHQLSRRTPAWSVVAMLQPPAKGGGLRLWNATYIGDDAAPEGYRDLECDTLLYREGDVVAFDSYRLHQIRAFGGALDRISATVHVAEIDAGVWESWF